MPTLYTISPDMRRLIKALATSYANKHAGGETAMKGAMNQDRVSTLYHARVSAMLARMADWNE